MFDGPLLLANCLLVPAHTYKTAQTIYRWWYNADVASTPWRNNDAILLYKIYKSCLVVDLLPADSFFVVVFFLQLLSVNVVK